MNKNGYIEFWRFYFTIFVCLLHVRGDFFRNADYFGGGYIAVEFFLILSGILMMKSYENKPTNPFQFTIRRLLRLYPHYIFSFIMLFILKTCIVRKLGIYNTLKKLIASIWEIFLLQMSGIEASLYNFPTWYISALFITGLFVYNLIYFNKEKYLYIVPLIVLIIYGYYSRNVGNIDIWKTVTFNINDGLIRSFAGMSLGCLCYFVIKKLNTCDFKESMILFLDLIQVILYMFVICCGIFKRRTQYDFICIIFLAIALIISFSQTKGVVSLFTSRFFAFLGNISYAIFLNHVLIREIFKQFFSNTILYNIFSFMIIVILYSICTHFFVNFIFSKVRILIKKY